MKRREVIDYIIFYVTDQVEEFFKVWQGSSYFMKRKEGFVPVYQLIAGNQQLVKLCLEIAIQVIRCLRGLHDRSICQRYLQLDDIYVKVTKKVSAIK